MPCLHLHGWLQAQRIADELAKLAKVQMEESKNMKMTGTAKSSTLKAMGGSTRGKAAWGEDSVRGGLGSTQSGSGWVVHRAGAEGGERSEMQRRSWSTREEDD